MSSPSATCSLFRHTLGIQYRKSRLNSWSKWYQYVRSSAAAHGQALVEQSHACVQTTAAVATTEKVHSTHPQHAEIFHAVITRMLVDFFRLRDRRQGRDGAEGRFLDFCDFFGLPFGLLLDLLQALRVLVLCPR
jgi:hypothetical protein